MIFDVTIHNKQYFLRLFNTLIFNDIEYFLFLLKNRFHLSDDIDSDEYYTINTIAETMQQTGDKKVFSDSVRSGDKGRVSSREVEKSNKPQFVSEIFE